MIRENKIEDVLDQMGEENFDDQFAIEEPEYWHYLNSDSFKGLSEAEHKLLFFINSVIYHSCKDALEDDYSFDIEVYQSFEEENWSVREESKSWTTTSDLFFKGYQEEDLLAFVEDMLAPEENEDLSELAREVIFITAKSYIDSFVGDPE